MSEINNNKDNKGFLFVNQNKNKPTQPDQTGRITVEGKEYRISAWDSVSADGKKYISLKLSPYIPPNTDNYKNDSYNKQAKSAAPLLKDLELEFDMDLTLDLDQILNDPDTK
jgi:hypothetical protein